MSRMNCIWTPDYWRKRERSQDLKCRCSSRPVLRSSTAEGGRESALTFSLEKNERTDPALRDCYEISGGNKTPLPVLPEGGWMFQFKLELVDQVQREHEVVVL